MSSHDRRGKLGLRSAAFRGFNTQGETPESADTIQVISGLPAWSQSHLLLLTPINCENNVSTLGHPWDDKRAEGNPYNTIFVGRLNYTTTEERLKREFEIYGPVEGVRVVKNKFTKKSRGYAFVEFRNERDADCKCFEAIKLNVDAVSRADGRRVEGRKVIVDRELGRTRKDWLPRRLGGGKGDQRRDRNDEDTIRKLKFELD